MLAGRVGPGHNTVPCRKTNAGERWSCCTDARRPCLAKVSGPQAVWAYNKSTKSLEPQVCEDGVSTNYCCRTTKWPEGAASGYPYRIDGDGEYLPHFAKLWPYGGAGYALSRGLLDAIPRDHWQECAYALQCANADHRVMTCVLAAGFSLTAHGHLSNGAYIPGIVHHVHGQNAANTSTSEAGLTSRQKASLHGMTGLTRVSHGVGAASRRPKEGNGSGYVIRVHP